MRGSLDYEQFLGTGLTFTPSLSLAHDVQGVSADSQLNEGRIQAGLNLEFSYNKVYTMNIGYVYFAPWAKYDPLRDHDFYSLDFRVTF